MAARADLDDETNRTRAGFNPSADPARGSGGGSTSAMEDLDLEGIRITVSFRFSAISPTPLSKVSLSTLC